jgi:hypothetical protein
MFFSKFARLREERGSALIAVLGLTMVTAIIGVTITAVTVNALGTTTSNRASVESRAAAEAGIDVATVGLQTATSCAGVAGVYSSATAPEYEAKIQYDAGAGWVAGCPIDTATKVRIVSTGTAQAAGVAGATAGDTTVLEGIFNYVPDFVHIPPVDAAVYAYSIQGALKNFELSSSSNSLTSDVQIAHGNVDCTNGAKIAGNLILGDGHAYLNNCAISGTVHVSDYADITGGGSIVNGDVIAAGVNPGAGGFVGRVSAGAIVEGSVLANGTVKVLSSTAARVKGSITVAGDAASAGTVAVGSTVEGSLVSSGTTDVKGTVLGTVTNGVTGLDPAPIPLIPDWTDIPYPSATWAAEGYTIRNWTGACTIDGGDVNWLALSAITTPTVINMMGCGAAGLKTLSSLSPIVLNANLAFVANTFDFDKIYMSSLLTPHTLNFIVPDNVANDGPTCPGPAPIGNITFHNEANFSANISAMAYTPCKVYSDRDGWRGQIYGGEVEFGAQAKLTFVPVGVPGVDFSHGATVPHQIGAHLGNRVSLRELPYGG